MSELSKSYDPSGIEQSTYERWLQSGLFSSKTDANKKPYSILMPPPNVTGVLTMGHVINHTIQDIYIRRHRMEGMETCWFPGLDHAGIATQTKVEQQLRESKLTRHDLGREKFLEKVWEWRNQYGDIILKQLRSIGISCDWDRTLFTMDESASNAVRETFIRLFDEGLIYRGKRIINWSPVAQSALSDEEVLFREVKEHIYTLRYHFESGNGWLNVATVRPETIFGDVAVAVNPHDERYKHLIGSNVIVPITGKAIPIIGDDYADPTFGTGCVKITPAHDPNDFEVGIRHSLPMPNAINADATLNELAGEFKGLDRFEARKKVMERLKELDLIEKVEDYTHNVGFSERGGEPVEPYLSDQWFVNMKPLAEPALKAVLEGEITFYPNHWVKTYEHWMTGIRDWCISRQLWWGHRIPVFYAEDGSFTAAASEVEARKKLGLPADANLVQDPDVLDTWFSSWLWPMTTMQWLANGTNEQTEDMSYYLPSNLLVTGPDIIFFWVARMIMASLKFTGKIPFRDVYFTSIIRDGKGRKMSKSLGNSPDPLNVIDKYGADALRFTIVYLAPLGTDVRLEVKEQDVPQVELGRNFANKIWNAGRFLLMKREENQFAGGKSSLSEDEMSAADLWIRSRYHSTIKQVANHLHDYRITEYARTLHEFIWRDFCDWYVEILKSQINASEDAEAKARMVHFAMSIFDGTMRLLHPVMPFISETLWQELATGKSTDMICNALNPSYKQEYVKKQVEESFELLQMLVEEIRKMRSIANIQNHQKLPVILRVPDAELSGLLLAQSSTLSSLGRASAIIIAPDAVKPDNALSSVIRGIDIFIETAGAIDQEKEKDRLTKEAERLSGLIRLIEGKLNNPGFVSKAPEQVVKTEQEKLTSIKDSHSKILENLSSLG
ncbi:MAG: valine--tRNA ligase [Ignavibacteria bacterium]|nr:valine--tRNA ligase [Ignavibacteria bacterium]